MTLFIRNININKRQETLWLLPLNLDFSFDKLLVYVRYITV